MNESVRLLVLALLGLLTVSSCRGDPPRPPLAGASLGGPFDLIDHQGRRVTDREFAGRYRLIYFGFASCPDVCPTDLASIGAGLRQLERSDPRTAELVQPIFITVDPARDTPERLRQYVANFHPRLIGLTGSEAEIARVARAYGIAFQRGEPSRPGGADYLVDHSRLIILYDREGRPLAILPPDRGAEGIASEVRRWVR
jgi:protein SCO1/2